MSDTSKAILAGNSGNIRIGGGSHGQNEDIVVYGQDIEKGSFVKFVNYPSTSSVFSDDVEPDNDDVYYEGVVPLYLRISDDIVVKFWYDKPFATTLSIDDTWTLLANGGSYYNINIRAKWYKIVDEKINWDTGKKVIFPDITKSPELFNETGTNVKDGNYYAYHYSNSYNYYDANMDPYGKAYDDGVYPFGVNSGYWAEDKDNAYVEDLSVEPQQDSRINIIVSYGLHSHHDASPYRDVVYENCRVISFDFEYNAQSDELLMQQSDFITGYGIGCTYRSPDIKNFFCKQYNDIVSIGRPYASAPFENGYNNNKLAIDGTWYRSVSSIKYSIHNDMNNVSSYIEKIGPAFYFSGDGIVLRHCNEGFSCRQKNENNIYSLIYVAHGGTTVDSEGYGDNDTIYNSLELQLNDTVLATINNAIPISFRHENNSLTSCFVDLCIMSQGSDDIILTAHQNNDKIYLNVYRHHIYTGNVTLTSQSTINCSNVNENTGLFYGSITIKKIDENHALLIKNATTSVSDNSEILNNAKIYLITITTSSITVENLSVSSENAKLVTSLPNINVTSCQIITDEAATSSKTHDYYAVDIMNILTGIPCKIGIKIDRSSKSATISNSVYETTERAQKTTYPYEVEGVSRQSGKHGDTIRVTKRI